MPRYLMPVFLAVALPVFAQVPVIIDEIGELEGVRDPKCYATASRLEDFIYGTPLESEARFEKIALQKAWIRAVWAKASAGNPKEIGAEALRPVLQASVPYTLMPDGSFVVGGTVVTARDKRQYGSVAYALRAILAVQQDALTDGTVLAPLSADAVELFKEAIDLTTLAALQRADQASRKANHDRIQPATLKSAWKEVAGSGGAAAASAAQKN
ncbi:MAG TPA: hypothetical protein VNI54_12630, partial [Thermoanaerobaculia bacterium]|nr:hypothetical protein [Thermoanaerobaculia bacterium]